MKILCSKCKVNDRAKRNAWCRPCNATADRARYAISPIADRTCKKCGCAFRGKMRKTPICLECSKAENRRRYAENIAGYRDKSIARNIPAVRRKQKLTRDYGLTEEQVGAMLYLQECKCAVCRVEFTAPESRKGQKDTAMAVDHDHLTGEVRGLLCIKCNKALGGFRDDASLLHRAAFYLEASAES